MTIQDDLQTFAPPNKYKRLMWPAIATAIALVILLGLGVWQLQRLKWKVALLAQIQSRIHQPTQPIPAQSQWAGLKALDYDYRHVNVTGTFNNKDEVLIFDGIGPQMPGIASIGYLVLTPLTQTDGTIIIVNRGFVPVDKKLAASRPQSQMETPTTITGLMRPPQSRNFFTPKDNPGENQWFTRDPIEIAAHFHLANVAPFVIDQDPNGAAPSQLPIGGSTEIDIPNNHFSYALTWFGFALGLLGVFIGFAVKRWRED